MFRLIGRSLGFFAIPVCLAGATVAGATDSDFLSIGWELERDVEVPSYAVTTPTRTNLNIDTVVLSCEQGPSRRGLQLRLYLWDKGPLGPLGAGNDLDDHPTVDLIIDGSRHAAELLFADDFVVVADSADGSMPLLSKALLDAMQTGQRMELQFRLAKVTRGQARAFDGVAVVDLQEGAGGAAVAAVRRCTHEHSAMKERGDRFAKTSLMDRRRRLTADSIRASGNALRPPYRW